MSQLDLTLNDIAQALQNIHDLLDKEWADAPSMKELTNELNVSTNTIRKWMDRLERETDYIIVGRRVRRPTRVEGEHTMVPVYRIVKNETTSEN